MATLKKHLFDSTLKLAASGLMETLVAMVMLLTVFAIGMLIFANLTKSSISQSRKEVFLQMQQLHADWELSNLDFDDQVIQLDSISYQVQSSIPKNYPDLRMVTVYAFLPGTDVILDSLSAYHRVSPFILMSE